MEWIKLKELTTFWTMHGRWSRIFFTISNGYTGSLTFNNDMAVSININIPVRPIPAEPLDWTTAFDYYFNFLTFFYLYIGTYNEQWLEDLQR